MAQREAGDRVRRGRVAADTPLPPYGMTIGDLAERLRRRPLRPDWRNDAACVGAGVEVFYCGDDAPYTSGCDDGAVGRATCADCPVRWDCLQEAVGRAEPFGIWGGFDAFQRERIRRRHPAAYRDIRASVYAVLRDAGSIAWDRAS